MQGPTIVRRRSRFTPHTLALDVTEPDGAVAVSADEPHDIPPALQRLFSKIAGLSSLPLLAERILRLSSERQTDTFQLIELIQSDPAMNSCILRRVNSSYFGISRKVTSLERAGELLGFPELRNLALTVIVKRLFDHPASYGTYRRELLWRHCLAVAVSARKIARVTGAASQHEAYVAGLLHHLGTLMIDFHMRSRFCSLIDRLDDNRPTYEQEREQYSFDQGQLGAYMARRWQFPANIVDAVRYHETPHEYRGSHNRLVYVVAVADYLCGRAGMTAMGVFNTTAPDSVAYATLGVDRVSLAIIWDDLLTHLTANTDF